jgi:5-formyltetrahydrofolate cyclo-ligase
VSLATIKAEARKAAFARRRVAHGERPDGAAQARLLALLRQHEGKPLAGYMPMRSEIDPLPVMAARAAHVPVGVPVIGAGGRGRRWWRDRSAR